MQTPMRRVAGAALLIMGFAMAGQPALADAPPDPPADIPTVATDIPPVHSLVARVMEGVGAPALILPPGASPHGHAMRPSEAAALDRADLVVWMGPALTPWLARSIEVLAGDARSLALLGAEGTHLLAFRDGPAFEGHAHGGHAHGEHAHGEHAGEGGHDGSDGHSHTGVDPHAWLDPLNAKLWLDAIAEALAALDPSNAATYATNAAAGQAGIDALAAELTERLAPLREKPFIVFHDAYHYFEHRFGIEAEGALAPGDAAPPGPARISAMRDLTARTGAVCIFAEPQFPADLIATVTEGTAAQAAVLDPLGAMLEPGPGLYGQMMRDLAAALGACLDPAG